MYSSEVQLRLVVEAGPVHQLRRPRRDAHDLAVHGRYQGCEERRRRQATRRYRCRRDRARRL